MRLYFYADENDIHFLSQKIFETLEVKLIQSAWLEGTHRYEYYDIGHFTEEVSSNSKLRMYFACNREEALRTKRLTLDNGLVKLSVNHGVMPDTVRILFGSKLTDKMILQSTIDGFCDTKASKALFRSLKKIVVANARKVGDVYLFPGAEEKYNAHWVLTPNREAINELHFKL